MAASRMQQIRDASRTQQIQKIKPFRLRYFIQVLATIVAPYAFDDFMAAVVCIFDAPFPKHLDLRRARAVALLCFFDLGLPESVCCLVHLSLRIFLSRHL